MNPTPSSPNQENNNPFDLVQYIKDILDLRKIVDKKNTVKEIKDNLSFRGIQVYILAASIIIASIGLNANSTAVVIGAMLLSPLMGPIVGFGYAIGVNDMGILKKSSVNIFVMVFVAIFFSYLYFELIPLRNLTDELRGRIEPTFLDVLIAIFGGLAGIVASSSENKNINAIAGVAIATALMPPLCTVGYGLATGSELVGYKGFSGWNVALNSFYLFLINSTFIAVSTLLYVRVLQFPLRKLEDPTRKKNRSIILVILLILFVIPSGVIFFKMMRDSQKQLALEKFLHEDVKYNDTWIDTRNYVLQETDSITYIKLSCESGNIPYGVIDNWNKKLNTLRGFDKAKLIVYQGPNAIQLKEEMEDYFSKTLLEKNQLELVRKDSIISSLEHQISRLNSDTIVFSSVNKEIRAFSPIVEEFGYANFTLTRNNKNKEVIPAIIVTYKKGTSESNQKQETQRIYQFMKSRLKLDTLKVIQGN